MSFGARGLPIHTRSLSVTLRQGSEGDLAFHAYVLDLRKRGVVPVGGDLQASGIIHQMILEGTVDPTVPAYRRIAARMPIVAFEPSDGTGGESCRDRIDRVPALAGRPLGSGHARGVNAEIGGILGCSHVLTLAQLLGPTVVWALEWDRARDEPPARGDGERLFRRDLTVDGYVDGDALFLLAQLNDLHLRPGAQASSATDRFAGQTEVRIQGEVSLDDMRISDVRIEERRRTLETLDATPWRRREDRGEVLEGMSLGSGYALALQGRFGDAADDRPLLDTMHMLAPAVIQCLASYRDSWTALGTARGSETGGYPDSCYMWRTGGALQSRRSDRGGT